MSKLYIYIRDKIKAMALNIKELIEHATSQGYRSNVVKPLSGLLIILFCAGIVLAYIGQDILAYAVFGMLIIAFFAYGFAYFYCLFRNPDLLRSEKYNLEKSAIEKVAVLGDSTNQPKVLHPPMNYVIIESQNKVNPTEENKN